MDAGEVLSLVSLNAIIDSILGLVIGIFIVAKFVLQRWKTWLLSPDAEPYMDKVAERVIAKLPPMPKVPTAQEIVAAMPAMPEVPSTEDFMAKLEPRLQGFEERLNEPVQLDLEPIVEMVSNAVVPKVKEEIERVRAVIDGKIGWVKKVGKGVGEAVAERVGEEAAAAAGIEGPEGEVLAELDAMLNDDEWSKTHKVAAFGLRLLKKEMAEKGGRGITLHRGGKSGKGLLRLRR